MQIRSWLPSGNSSNRSSDELLGRRWFNLDLRGPGRRKRVSGNITINHYLYPRAFSSSRRDGSTRTRSTPLAARPHRYPTDVSTADCQMDTTRTHTMTGTTADCRATTARTDQPTTSCTDTPAERAHLTELLSDASMVPDLRPTSTTIATSTIGTPTPTRTADDPNSNAETGGCIERALEGERR